MTEKIELDTYYYHELMDRIHVVLSTIDDHILTHPVSDNHKQIKEWIEDAQTQLYKAYSLAGSIDFELFDD